MKFSVGIELVSISVSGSLSYMSQRPLVSRTIEENYFSKAFQKKKKSQSKLSSGLRQSE